MFLAAEKRSPNSTALLRFSRRSRSSSAVGRILAKRYLAFGFPSQVSRKVALVELPKMYLFRAATKPSPDVEHPATGVRHIPITEQFLTERTVKYG